MSADCLGASSGAVPVHTEEGPRSFHQEDILDGGRLSDDRLHSARTRDTSSNYFSIVVFCFILPESKQSGPIGSNLVPIARLPQIGISNLALACVPDWIQSGKKCPIRFCVQSGSCALFDVLRHALSGVVRFMSFLVEFACET